MHQNTYKIRNERKHTQSLDGMASEALSVATATATVLNVIDMHQLQRAGKQRPNQKKKKKKSAHTDLKSKKNGSNECYER